MEDSKWEKFAALGGVAFVVLNVVGAVGTGSPPDPGKPDQVAKWFNDHAGAIKLSQFLGVLSVIALLWWFGSLWRKMAIAEGGRYRLSIVAALGLVFSGTMLMAANATLSATALRVDDLQSGATIFYTLSNVLLASAGAGIVTFLTATSVLTLRAKMLPSWMGYLGLLSAALFLVATIGSANDSTAFMLFGLLGFVAWSLWTLGVSFELWKHPASATANTTATASASA